MGETGENHRNPPKIASHSPRRHSQKLEARPERWSGIAQGRANVDVEAATQRPETRRSSQGPGVAEPVAPGADWRGRSRAMDASDEKAAEAAGEHRAAATTPDVFVDARSQNSHGATAQNSIDHDRTAGEDPEKDAIHKEIRNKHLSTASSTDAAKRESIETPPRWSAIMSDSDAASEHTIQATTPMAEADARPPATRSRVTLQIPDDHDDDEDEHRTGAAPPIRPAHTRGATMQSGITVASSRRSMPPLRRRETKLMQKEAHPMEHLGITLGLPMVLLFDLVVPCIAYYVWYDIHGPNPKYDRGIMGGAVACFGFGEIWILAARVWRLVFRREDCAPLLSRSKWDLDATAWVYGVSIACAVPPFVIGAEKEIPQLYLYSPCFIFGFLAILMLGTIVYPFTLPIGINSQERGTKIRPFVFYAAEDFIAVDGLQDREFRVRYNERYQHNFMFRRFFFWLTMFWFWGCLIYIGCASAIIWSLAFNHAFGLVFGILFSWIGLWCLITWRWVKWEMKRENKAYEEGRFDS